MADTVAPEGIDSEAFGDAAGISGAPARYDVSGTGYLGGEYPGGTTTVAGVPTSAQVQVLYELPTGDWQLVDSVTSAPDGTWQVTGLNHELEFHIVGRLAGHNDVLSSGVLPVRSDLISTTGQIAPNADFTGADSFVEIIGGYMPYTVSVVDALPSGMFPVIDGRKLLVDGVTTDDAVVVGKVRVTSSNSVSADVPITLVVGFKAPAEITAVVDELGGSLQVLISWTPTATTQATWVYRSDVDFDMEHLPPSIAVAGEGEVSFVDVDVLDGQTKNYLLAAVHGEYIAYSAPINILVSKSDPFWIYVIALLKFDGDLIDATGGSWLIGSAPPIDTSTKMFGSGSLHLFGANYKYLMSSGISVSQRNWYSGSYTIECFAHFTGFKQDKNGRPFLVSDSVYSPGTSNWQFGAVVGGRLAFSYWSGAVTIIKSDAGVLAVGSWHHIAMSHDSAAGVVRLFVDGVAVAEVGAFPAPAIYATDGIMVGLGGYSEGDAMSECFVDELRITAGVARYKANFSVPTSSFSSK